MMKLVLSTIVLLSLSCFGQGTGSSGTTPDQSSSQSSKSAKSKTAAKDPDSAFAKKAATGGMTEVELGKLATEKAQSEDVKKFGQRMIDDHSKANDELKQIAATKGITLPSDLDAKNKATKDRLAKLSGKSFDHAYMQFMVQDHTKDVADFKKEATKGSDPDIKNFASTTLPTLEEHLKQAKEISAKLGGAAAKGSPDSQP